MVEETKQKVRRREGKVEKVRKERICKKGGKEEWMLMKRWERWQLTLTKAIIKSLSGASRSQHRLRLIQARLTPSYLVKESLEDAGGFDWQRAGDSDLFFQYYCRRWEEKGEGGVRQTVPWGWCWHCCSYELNPVGYTRVEHTYSSLSITCQWLLIKVSWNMTLSVKW